MEKQYTLSHAEMLNLVAAVNGALSLATELQRTPIARGRALETLCERLENASAAISDAITR